MRKPALWIFIVILFLTSLACSLGGQTPPAEEGASATTPPTAEVAEAGTDTAPAATQEGEDDEPPPAGEMSFEGRSEAMEALTAFLNELPAESETDDNAAMVEYLSSRPEFADAGVSADNTVWAEFIDGRLLLIFNNRELGPLDGEGSARLPRMPLAGKQAPAGQPKSTAGRGQLRLTGSTAQVGGANLPQSDQAYVLSAMGTAFKDATGDLEKWFSDSKYAVNNAAPTVEMLKKVAGAGFFYLGSHGGNLDNFHGDPVHAIWTATPIDAFNETLLRLDIEAGRVVYAAAKQDLNPTYDPERDSPKKRALYATHYAITGDFVTEYMSFSAGSMVYIDACSSAVADIKDAFIGKGASLYVGWDTTVGDGFADKSTRFLIDRLLGTNDGPDPEEPKQRPFDALAIKENMGKKGLLVEGDGTTLTFTKGSGNGGLLMPSIAYLEVHEESDELFIFGMFGTEKGEVTINKSPATVSNWSADVVTVKLPDEGDGSAGDVVVKVRDHESNAVPLTEWRGQVRYNADANSVAPNLLTHVVIEAHFRADIHPYREKPGEKPVEREVTFALAGDSKAHWVMEGSSTVQGTKFELVGSGELELEEPGSSHDKALFAITGTLVPQDMLAGLPPVVENVHVHLHLSSEPNTESTLRITVPGFGIQESGFPINQTDVLYDQVLQMDEEMTIEADHRETMTIKGAQGIGLGVLEWDDLTANHAPDPSDLPHAARPLAVVVAL